MTSPVNAYLRARRSEALCHRGAATRLHLPVRFAATASSLRSHRPQQSTKMATVKFTVRLARPRAPGTRPRTEHRTVPAERRCTRPWLPAQVHPVRQGPVLDPEIPGDLRLTTAMLAVSLMVRTPCPRNRMIDHRINLDQRVSPSNPAIPTISDELPPFRRLASFRSACVINCWKVSKFLRISREAGLCTEVRSS